MGSLSDRQLRAVVQNLYLIFNKKEMRPHLLAMIADALPELRRSQQSELLELFRSKLQKRLDALKNEDYSLTK